MSEKMSAAELAEVAKVLDADINTSAKRLFGRLLAHISTLQREADGMREALQEIDANTPTQNFVLSIPASGDIGHMAFIDVQRALANIGDIARAALNGSPQAPAAEGSK